MIDLSMLNIGDTYEIDGIMYVVIDKQVQDGQLVIISHEILN